MRYAFKPARPLRDFLHVLVAPTIWFAHLSIVYGTEALICRGSPAVGSAAMTWMLLLTGCAALAGLGVYAIRTFSSGNDRERFLPVISLILAFLSAWGVIWTTLPALFLPACAAPAG